VPWNVPAISIAAAIAALDDMAEAEARVSELKSARAELARELSRIPGVTALPSDGNFILLDVSKTRLSAERMVQSVLAEGVLIRSLVSHHADKSYVRVTVGTREQNARCVAAFERVIGRRAPREVAMPAYAGGDAE
jgi:histidinol-phosphate/aromatic aminotransferase/cobyric acid decarboxylase-like protein